MGNDLIGEAFSRSQEKLFKHVDRDYGLRGLLSSCDGLQMETNLRDIIFYQATFRECDWFDCDLTNVSANGSLFNGNHFYGSKVDNASLQNCSFSEDIFHNCTFHGSNLTQSTLFYSAIEGSSIHGCAFVSTFFDRTILRNCRITSSNFELSHFNQSILENLDLSNLTLKYTFFNDVRMQGVTLPFLQMPYTFNGLQYVFKTDDEITFESRSSKSKTMSRKEYMDMIMDFIVFFEGRQEYFPLANCCDVIDNHKKALSTNKTGIIESIARRDFRSLYYYCLQATLILRADQYMRTNIYEEINGYLHEMSLTPAEYYQFGNYYPRIKKLLLDNPAELPTLSITMKTNIGDSDFESLGLFIHLLENVSLESSERLSGKHLEIRRNSPAIIDFILSGNLNDLISFLRTTYILLQPILQDSANVATVLQFIGSSVKNIRQSRKEKRKSQCEKRTLSEEKRDREILKSREEIEDLHIINVSNSEVLPAIKREGLTNETLKYIKELVDRSVRVTELLVEVQKADKELLDVLTQQLLI